MESKIAGFQEAGEEATKRLDETLGNFLGGPNTGDEFVKQISGENETIRSVSTKLLGAVKMAVLAPCIKVHLNGAEAFTAGSADQVNFSQMANILERRVLAKRSQVKLLPDAVELADASAYTIFPELKEALGLIQKEVTERLLVMMQEAQTTQAR